MLAEQEKLVTDNMRLVHKVAQKYKQTPIEYEDLIAVGNVGLVKAACTFDATKSAKFSTYAYRCINNEILLELRKLKNEEVNALSLNTVLYGNDGDAELTIEETLFDEHACFEESIANKALWKDLMDTIEPRQKFVIRHLFQDDLTQLEIGQSMNMSQGYVSRERNRALDLMARKCKEWKI